MIPPPNLASILANAMIRDRHAEAARERRASTAAGRRTGADPRPLTRDEPDRADLVAGAHESARPTVGPPTGTAPDPASADAPGSLPTAGRAPHRHGLPQPERTTTMDEIASIFSFGAGGAARATALALALLAGGAGALSGSALLAHGDEATMATADGCVDATLGVDADPWARSELFFGTAKPDGSAVSEADWNAFLADEVTARFPDGLTVLDAAGQWQSGDGTIVRERSKQLILLYPRAAAAEAGEKIEAIRAAYETTFDQESVLRADDGEPAPVCVSF